MKIVQFLAKVWYPPSTQPFMVIHLHFNFLFLKLLLPATALHTFLYDQWVATLSFLRNTVGERGTINFCLWISLFTWIFSLRRTAPVPCEEKRVHSHWWLALLDPWPTGTVYLDPQPTGMSLLDLSASRVKQTHLQWNYGKTIPYEIIWKKRTITMH